MVDQRLKISRRRLAGAALLLLAAVPAGALAAIGAFPIGTFSNPVYVTTAPGAPSLLFVVEQPGQIQVLSNGARAAQPFLDIRDIVLGSPDPAAGGEQGLLSVAFPPDYATSRRFYVDFTNANGDVEIDQFRRPGSNPLIADRTTRRVVLIIPHGGAQNHNGGQLQFGPDGWLYISVGDGGNLSPPGEPARDLDDLRGKILRISPVGTDAQPYTIPPTNPFVGKPGRDEIFAYGFRNPWRFAFDGTRLAIGDVGQSSREEVDLLPTTSASGANFGWPQYEGDLIFDNTRPGPAPPTFPVFVYDHSGGRCAIIGGYVVRDPNLPAFAGRYIYGDACTGEIRSFLPNLGHVPPVLDDRTTGLVLPGLTSFGLGPDRQIYAAQGDGTVSRISIASGPRQRRAPAR
jgi:glucose/arabinose dehydrogenase